MKIGDFARAGQVSVRMLRHYDALGLLPPAHVDEWSGHRSYEPAQLARLDRIVALNQLGFTLDEVRGLIDAPDDEHMASQLRERRAALAAEAHRVNRRLADVVRRLHLSEEENTMPHEFVTKTLPATRVLSLRGRVASQPEIAAAIEPLFNRVSAAITVAGGCPQTGVATYTWPDGDAGGAVEFTAGYRYTGAPVEGFEVLQLPAVEAATTIHLGEMSHIGESWAALDRWVGENGWAFDGPCREVYLEAGDGSDDDQSCWVTELQQPVRR